MKTSRHLLLALAGSLALALVVVIWVRMEPREQGADDVSPLPSGVELALQEIDYTHTENGVPRWRLVAERVEQHAGTRVTAIRQPRLYYYDVRGEELGSIAAESGELPDDYSRVTLWQDVEIHQTDGYALYTDRLYYDQSRRMVSTESPVRVVASGMVMKGRGMVYWLDTEKLVIQNDVRVTMARRTTE